MKNVMPRSRPNRTFTRKLLAGLLAISLASAAEILPADDAVPCGDSFMSFVNGLKAEAIGNGHNPALVDTFFANVSHEPSVIRRDRNQGIFRKSFVEFSKLVMSDHRINASRSFEEKHRRAFELVEQRFGTPRGVLLSFLALETDFGLVQGDFNTLNSLVTLAHDCRRPELFRPHVFAALELFGQGSFDPVNTVGAWAGEIGMIQMLPADILKFGEDGDGDGQIDLRNSVDDALMTAGRVLDELGWVRGQPWLTEIHAPPDLDWTATGLSSQKPVGEWQNLGVRTRGDIPIDTTLEASVLVPNGIKGPAFYAFPNFRTYFEWNQSFVYSTTSAFFATLLAGAPMYLEGNPDPPLSDDETVALQKALVQRGHDVGKIDGIIGKMTRAAIKAEQARLGLPADEWPTKELLSRLTQ